MADALKIYLSGPMTGLPDMNYPAFHAEAARLRAMGHMVYNPAEYPHDGPAEAFPIRQAFSDYCRFLCLEANAIFMLRGWQSSRGAQIEYRLADYLGLTIYQQLHRPLIQPAAEGKAHG
ncbi:DUF4406 domain-containing protein [uncultured Martelella sp.]|uniref:DUF4406 domain-containing protein n=1 Tax=uncultured Martelella sp. TaxID=392331 RepID=UPI0029C7DA43|nr:DUF4406 domain-containing protein [uncultured Martelella sp.]